MKLATATAETSTASASAFQFEDNSKLFAILSDKIYSDKPRAVVREYCCNALDIHMRIGQNRPFIVTLPTRANPFLVIRDFGTGLRHQLVRTLFCTYFASDKTDNNLELGGFGLGSKAGFAYADSFHVRSFQDGEVATYECFKGSDGVPQLGGVERSDTDEPDGLEIIIPIALNDIYTFTTTAQDVLRWFPVGSFELFGATVTPVQPTVSTENWMIRKGTTHEVLMGSVAYKLDWKLVDPTIKLPTNIVPVFKIGELDLPPSRETISYDPKTIQVLKDRADLIAFEVAQESVAKSANMGPVERLAYIEDLRRNSLSELFNAYHVAQGHRAEDDANFALSGIPANERYRFKDNRWGTFFEAKYERIVLDAPVDTREFRSTGRSKGVGRTASLSLSGKRFVNADHLTNAYLIFHDLTDHHAPRVFDRLNTLEPRKLYYLVHPSAAIQSVANLKALFNDLPADRFLTLSEIEVPPKARKQVTYDTVIYAMRSDQRGFYETDQVPTGGLWVPFNGTSIDNNAMEHARALSSLGWTDQPIWGLTKKAQKQLLDDDFIPLDVYVREKFEMAISDPTVIASIQARGVLHKLRTDDDLKQITSFIERRANLGHLDLLPDATTKMQAALLAIAQVGNSLVDRTLTTCGLFGIKPPKAADNFGLIKAVKKCLRKNPTLDLILKVQDRAISFDAINTPTHILNKIVRN